MSTIFLILSILSGFIALISVAFWIADISDRAAKRRMESRDRKRWSRKQMHSFARRESR